MIAAGGGAVRHRLQITRRVFVVTFPLAFVFAEKRAVFLAFLGVGMLGENANLLAVLADQILFMQLGLVAFVAV